MLDLLGVVAWNRDGVRPYIMLGPTAVELDIAATYSAQCFVEYCYDRYKVWIKTMSP